MATGLGERVAVAKALLQAFECRDNDRLLSLLAPDADFRTRIHVTDETDFRGRDTVRTNIEVIDETYDRFELHEPEFVKGAGDAVVVFGRLSLRYRGDEYAQSRAVHWVCRVDEERGLVTSLNSYRDRRDALQAAGLET